LVLPITLFFYMKTIKFIKSVYKINDLPKDGLQHVILCGRSNVGKSSFINKLFGKKKVALTSSAPGKTRALNFYLAENKFYIVDLPGFGYAKIALKEREAWERLITEYLKVENNINLAFHLIDSRHKPTSLDILLNNYLRELNIPYIVLMSKVDKLKQSEFFAAKRNFIKEFPELLFGENFFPLSSVSGTGKREVENILNRLFIL